MPEKRRRDPNPPSHLLQQLSIGGSRVQLQSSIRPRLSPASRLPCCNRSACSSDPQAARSSSSTIGLPQGAALPPLVDDPTCLPATPDRIAPRHLTTLSPLLHPLRRVSTIIPGRLGGRLQRSRGLCISKSRRSRARDIHRPPAYHVFGCGAAEHAAASTEPGRSR